MSAALEWLPGWNQPPITDQAIRVIGIDLGTTNSTVTEIVWDPTSGEPPLASLIDIPQRTMQGEVVQDLVPSVVSLLDGIEYIGEGAHRMRSTATVPLHRDTDIWWETKNEIGTCREYVGAPEGYRTPRESLIFGLFNALTGPVVGDHRMKAPRGLDLCLVVARSGCFVWFRAGLRLPSPHQGDGTSAHQPVR